MERSGYGGTGGNTNQAVLDITDEAIAATLIGDIEVHGDALAKFASGAVGSIASSGKLIVDGANAFVANAAEVGSNSALAALATNAGDFELYSGASVAIASNLTNSGTLSIDPVAVNGPIGKGGSTLTVNGTLNNTGRLVIGSGPAAPTTAGTDQQRVH